MDGRTEIFLHNGSTIKQVTDGTYRVDDIFGGYGGLKVSGSSIVLSWFSVKWKGSLAG